MTDSSGAPPPFTDATTLGEVRAYLRTHAVQPGGTTCPGCAQHTQVYRRVMTANMAVLLVRFYRTHGQEWGHASTLNDGTGDFAKLRHWGLVEESTGRRTDGGRAGWWHITDRGVAFLRRGTQLARRIELYAGQLIGTDTTQMITIHDALGTSFRLDQLMAEGAGTPPDLTAPAAPAAP